MSSGGKLCHQCFTGDVQQHEKADHSDGGEIGHNKDVIMGDKE